MLRHNAFICKIGCSIVVYSAVEIAIPVFVRKGQDGKAQLVLLDHGLYDYLNSRDRIRLCHLYKAIISRDEDMMKHYSLQLGVTG